MAMNLELSDASSMPRGRRSLASNLVEIALARIERVDGGQWGEDLALGDRGGELLVPSGAVAGVADLPARAV